MEENKIRCIYCGDYNDPIVYCPKCGVPVCIWCLAEHLSGYHGKERDEREKEDDRW
jgi:hypothetical protein